ncbi:type I restriction-modification system methyltransferase subunit [Thermoanaerobacterium thermosaccharolyticum]|uniref:Type I restriction-modification system methyltransferase subunit n=1 Tax=Thermoanaerobacterium thermosaccharolyticum TaxID=1517 RepID=A0A223HWA9_THETR|nr:type I restriction-modification system methyltransferase subunit [Thermoanaerobacterium thermosaccharolyticum]
MCFWCSFDVIVLLYDMEELWPLIFTWEEDCCRRSIPFGNNPDLSLAGLICGQYPLACPGCHIIQIFILLTKVSPVIFPVPVKGCYDFLSKCRVFLHFISYTFYCEYRSIFHGVSPLALVCIHVNTISSPG